MTDSAIDRKSIRRKEKAAKLADSNRQATIKSLMSTAFGREWMWGILARCHCFATTFNGDALQSAFMEGQRAIGLTLISDIMIACPDLYIQAQRESNERSNLDERRSSQESSGGDSGSADSDDSADYRDIDSVFDPTFGVD